MSEYNVGDKFIVEIDSIYNDELKELYKVKGFNSLVFDDNGLDKLEKYDEVNERLELIEELKQEEYNRGLNDVWVLVNRMLSSTGYDGFTKKEFNEIFGKKGLIHVLENEKPQEVLAKVEAYDNEHNEVKVGDVITTPNGVVEYLVLRVEYNPRRILHVTNTRNGTVGTLTGDVKKTGKHMDVSKLFNAE